MSELKDYQKKFIALALESNALEFGEFTLKSGRVSPYFFNAAKMLNGCDLYELANCYVEAINHANVKFDCLYGPAYKGIFLGSIVAMIFSKKGTPYPLSFNRKEIKDHGEGGKIIGADPAGDVMIIDDVLSAGTAARESVKLIKEVHAVPKAFLVGLDRQEKGKGKLSASEELGEEYGIDVLSIINLNSLIEFSKNNSGFQAHASKLENYRDSWGA